MTDLRVSFYDGYGSTLNTRGIQQTSGKLADIQGDSGGPVLALYANGKVGAVGMIQGLQNETTTGCGSVHDVGSADHKNLCSKTVLFVSMRTIVRHVSSAALLTK